MRFIIRQKMFSLGDKFNITDQLGRAKYRVQGKFISIGKKLDIYDMNHNHLVHIKEEIFRFLPEYYLYEDGQVTAKVKKQLTFLKPKINIDSKYGDFTIHGSVFEYNFTVKKDGKVVAKVSKALLSFSDTYGVDVYDENVDFILALVIVIDQIFHDNRNKD